jgi:hypothetical protein
MCSGNLLKFKFFSDIESYEDFFNFSYAGIILEFSQLQDHTKADYILRVFKDSTQ